MGSHAGYILSHPPANMSIASSVTPARGGTTVRHPSRGATWPSSPTDARISRVAPGIISPDPPPPPRSGP
eukprot:3037510-Pyramimonas_sp.AAC.1